MALAKAKMTDTTTMVFVVPPSMTHQTCEFHHQHKRKRDNAIDEDEDENVVVINTSHQQRKRERKEEKKKKKKKEKKEKKEKEKRQPKFKAEEPIPRKKKRQRLDNSSNTSSPLTSVIHDPAPAQDLPSGVNNNKKKKKEEKAQDRDQPRSKSLARFPRYSLKSEVQADDYQSEWFMSHLAQELLYGNMYHFWVGNIPSAI